MPDHVLLDISHVDREALRKHNELDFKVKTSTKTGHMADIWTANFNGLTFFLYRVDIKLKGSLHQFYNKISGGTCTNYNDFTLENLKYVVEYLQHHFGINPTITKIHSLEYGVNVEIPLCPTKFIDNHLFSYKRNRGPSENKDYSGTGRAKYFKQSQYQIKLYDKGRQHRLHQHILRVEVKVTKSQYVQKLGIKTLEDLTKGKYLLVLKEDLLCRLDSLLILGSYIPESSPEYWSNTKAMCCPVTYRRLWNCFIARMEAEGHLNIKKDLLQRIETKCNDLINLHDRFLPLDKR